MSLPSTESRRFEPQAIAFAVPGGVSRRTRAARWLVALAIVAIVHALAGGWVERHRRFNRDVDVVDVPVQVALLTPQRIEQMAGDASGNGAAQSASNRAAGASTPASRHDALLVIVPADTAAHRKPAAHPAPKQSTGAAKPAARDAATSKHDDAAHVAAKTDASGTVAPTDSAGASGAKGDEVAASSPASATNAANASADATAAASNASASAAAANGGTPASPAASAPGTSQSAATGTAAIGPGGPGTHPTRSSGEKFALPPTADLRYDTFYNGVQNQAGTLRWATDGEHYQMVVSMSLPFVGTYSFTSEGRIDTFGLAPERYVEQRGRRGTDTTSFERNAPSARITFTRTPQVLPLSDGAQDRFSMVMQLASLVRGNPGAYTPGITRQFFVADSDSGETWPVEMIGTETVRTARGFVEAKHFMRLPRRDGDRRRIDIWLAPSLGYLPVRLVQTEPNGTEIELLWHGMPPPAEVQTAPRDTTAGTSGDTTAGASGDMTAGASGEPAPAGPNGAAADSAASGAPGITPADVLPGQSHTKP
jgi:hypothetical protein